MKRTTAKKGSTGRRAVAPRDARRTPRGGKCIIEDTLELYVLGRLPGQQMGDPNEAEVASTEIHLLFCASCQDRLMQLEQETRALRAALAQLPEAKPKTFAAGG